MSIKTKLDRKAALELWKTEKSGYAKEQLILSNLGLIGKAVKSFGLNPHDEDLFQNGAIGLIRAVNRFDTDKDTEFSAYAYKAIRHEICRMYAKKRVNVVFSLDQKADMGDGEADYDNLFPYKEQFEDNLVTSIVIGDAMKSLDEKETTVVKLYYFQNRKQHEIAEMIGLTKAGVSAVCKRACMKLRKELGA